jgi:hypothetical protein
MQVAIGLPYAVAVRLCSIEVPGGHGNWDVGVCFHCGLHYDSKSTPTASAKSPEQIRVGKFVGNNEIPICSDNLEF